MSNVLLGGAIGDALGVFAESKLSNYQSLIDWNGKTYLGSEHHGLKPGQYSDDTQFSTAVAQSLINSHGFDPDDLSKRYVELFTSKTIRGYGRTTLAAVNNLIDGKHWSESGIQGSYGNGTAMRAAPFGVYFRNDLKSLVNICKIDSAITHASDEAEAGSIAIALSAAYIINDDTDDLLDKLHEALPESKVKSMIYSLSSLLDNRKISPSVALRVIGTKADVRETVPAAIYCYLRFKKYHEAVEAAIRAGSDTDTTAAIVGALFGAKLGMKGIDRFFYNIENFDKLVKLDSQLYNRSSNSFLSQELNYE